MKAKDYAEDWIKAGKTGEKLGKIALSFVTDTQTLIKQRNIKHPDGLVAVLRETNRKWQAFANLFPGEVNPDGFRQFLLKQIPLTAHLHHLIWPDKTLPA